MRAKPDYDFEENVYTHLYGEYYENTNTIVIYSLACGDYYNVSGSVNCSKRINVQRLTRTITHEYLHYLLERFLGNIYNSTFDRIANHVQ